MSVNKHRPHIFVLPEDDANRQLVNGFLLEFQTRQVQPLKEAGGWKKVLECFVSDQVRGMERYPNRLLVLVLDFDGKDDRLSMAMATIPEHLRDRVFILGAWTEAEDFEASLGSYETIGRAAARDCRHGTNMTWGHPLLCHNASQIARLRDLAQPILFS
jgi:hypothetical protein